MTELRHWVSRILQCKTPTEIKEVLAGFSQIKWTLEERSIMSAIYTPRVLKWIRDDERKWFWLEDLEELCWRTC